MPDREKVIKGLEIHADGNGYLCQFCLEEGCPYVESPIIFGKRNCDIEQMCHDALELLKEQEAEKEALASLASLADRRRERIGKVLYDLCELGYPHNFQHEAPWVVDYLYKLTAIIKRAYEVKNNDNT